jgi:ribulose kinase
MGVTSYWGHREILQVDGASQEATTCNLVLIEDKFRSKSLNFTLANRTSGKLWNDALAYEQKDTAAATRT